MHLNKLVLLPSSSFFRWSSRLRRRIYLSSLLKLFIVLCIVDLDVVVVFIDMLVVFVSTVHALDVVVLFS